MRDLVDAELADLDAELEGSLAALVELEAAIVAYREQALELQSELDRRAATLAGPVEPSAR